MANLFSAIKHAATVTDEVIVAFSGGKDAMVVLDLCRQHFKTIHAFCMYTVPDLRVNEVGLRFCETRWGIKIIRVPHFTLAANLKMATYRFHSVRAHESKTPKTRRQMWDAMRLRFGCQWIVTGEKKTDSLGRLVNAYHADNGVHFKQKVIWPITEWSDKDVYSYLRTRGIPLPHSYRIFKQSFMPFHRDRELPLLKEHYPDDYAKVEKMFPLVGAVLMRQEIEGRRAKA